MRKDLLAAGVAVVAGAGAIAGVLVSSGGHGSSASPAAPTPSATTGPGGTTAPTPPGTLPPPPPPIAAPLPATTAALAPPPGPRSRRQRSFMVGVVDDSLAQADPAAARERVDVSRRAGFDAVVLTTAWEPGRTKPPPAVLRGIHNAGSVARREHMRLFLVAGHGWARNTPRTAAQRAQFASFAAEFARAVPSAYGMIVGNEPNLNTFWLPQFGPGGRDLAAAGYEDLLARTYAALKSVNPKLRVIGGTVSPRGADRPNGLRPTHSPVTFIRDLGAAYRSRHRHKPLMDAFAIHPYMISSALPPTIKHPKTREITLADYPKLVTLLDEAFRGTPQRGRTLPILYAEFGVQTRVPPGKLAAYEAGNAPPEKPVRAVTQAAYYRRALALAYCQPTVKGLFIFHTFDEFSLDGWQSGLYYADGTPKPSVGPFRRAVADLREGKLTTCR